MASAFKIALKEMDYYHLLLFSIPFLKQKADLKSILALILCLIGVVLISSGSKMGHLENPFSVFLSLLSAVIWAGYWIINMKDRRDESVKLCLKPNQLLR